MNRKGSDAPSFIYAIVIIAAIGIMLFLFSDIFLQLYSSIKVKVNDQYPQGSEANETISKVIGYEDGQSMWDYLFLAIVMGYVFVLSVLAFATPSNPWFFVIFVIIGMAGLFVGVALSNTWEAFATTPQLTSSASRFPITDVILNNFFTLFITLMASMITIMLFGKRFLGGGER